MLPQCLSDAERRTSPSFRVRVARCQFSFRMAARRHATKLCFVGLGVLLWICCIRPHLNIDPMASAWTSSQANSPVFRGSSKTAFTGIANPTIAQVYTEPDPVQGQPSGDQLSLSNVVIGIMTCDRYLNTRGMALSRTWLRWTRHLLFFSDSNSSHALHSPAVFHEFVPGETERVFQGGNWRALPILRTLGRIYFSSDARVRLTLQPIYGACILCMSIFSSCDILSAHS